MNIHYTPEPEERSEHIIRGLFAVLLGIGLVVLFFPQISKSVDQELGIYKKHNMGVLK